MVLGCSDGGGGGGWVVRKGLSKKQRKTTMAMLGVSCNVMFGHGS